MTADAAWAFAQMVVDYLAFFTPVFITFLVIEWALSFFRGQ